MKLVKDIIKQFVSQVDKEISVENIKQLVAKYFELPIEKLHGKTRLREVVIARQLSMYLAKTYTNSSCLLYTSDAAEQRSSVDLGGRRIIKKKTKRCNRGDRS